MNDSVFKMLSAWADQAEKLRNGEISKDQYDRWRYTFPKIEVQRTREALDSLRNKGK